jgi:hypothetical protein
MPVDVTIHCNHPISNPPGAPTAWDGKVHPCDADLLDVDALGAWLTKKVGFKFNYKPGHSRREGDKCVFFPARRVPGVHCMWVERARVPNAVNET